MSKAARRPITVEEFARMPDPPDASRQELVRGVILAMPLAGGRHGACCSRVGRRLGNFVDEKQLGTVTSNGTGFITERGPDTVRGADVAFWSKERLPDVPKGFIGVAPDLAVEVLSLDDSFSRVQAKVADYLAHGVRLLWIVDPEDRSVTVYRPDQAMRILGEADTLSCENVLPGFSCQLADLLP